MTTYKDPSGRWRYRFTYNGERHSGSAPSGSNLQKTAATLERKHLEKVMAGRWTGVMPTVATFIDQYLEHQKVRVAQLTYELHKTHLKKHVVPILGPMKLDRVGTLELDNLATRWKAEAAATTINVRRDTVIAMLSLAVDWGILVKVPKWERLKVPKRAPRFLSEPEAVALLAASATARKGTEWRSMILIGLRTGLRIGELRGLQWADIDLERAVLHVQRTDPGRAGLDANDPKGKRSRVVPLSPDAIACLREWLAAEKQRLGKHWKLVRWVWPGAETWRHQTDRYRTRAQGNCKTALGRYAKKAGLKGIGWHTLRHTFASWLVMRGVPMRTVQELLGHASIRETEKYAHLAPGFINQAVVAQLDIPLLPASSTPELPSGDSDDET